MKTLFLHARSTIPVSLPLDDISRLPQPVGVIASVQFLDRLQDFAAQVKGIPAGQVLGCKTGPAQEIAERVSCFLFIGSGKFHPLGVAISTGKPVFCYDPSVGAITRIEDKDIEAHKARQRGALLNFLKASKVGVLVSTKPGQARMAQALAFKRACKDKEVSVFVFDTLDREYLDNFTFIESWVNTACPRMPETFGKGMVSIDDVLNACPQYSIKDLQ